MIQIRIPKASAVDVDDKWAYAKVGLPLPVLDKPCSNCAVTTGFYEEHAARLAEESPDIQAEVLPHWFCHNHPHRACRGAQDYVKASNAVANLPG